MYWEAQTAYFIRTLKQVFNPASGEPTILQCLFPTCFFSTPSCVAVKFGVDNLKCCRDRVKDSVCHHATNSIGVLNDNGFVHWQRTYNCVLTNKRSEDLVKIRPIRVRKIQFSRKFKMVDSIFGMVSLFSVWLYQSIRAIFKDQLRDFYANLSEIKNSHFS